MKVIFSLRQGCSANKKVWELIQKITILKQLPTHFKAKRKKCGNVVPTPTPLGVGMCCKSKGF